MKGLIFDIKRFAIHDGPGIRVTVFFKGCPLSCWWCHNPESRREGPESVTRNHKINNRVFLINEQVGEWLTTDEVMKEILKEYLFFEESGGGVTFSGGEPLLQHHFLIDLLSACNRNSIHTTLDTTGYASQEVIIKVMNKVDLFLYDIKHMNDDVHKKYTGVSNKLIFDNLKFLHDEGRNIVIRFAVIPGINDNMEHIQNMIRFLKGELVRVKKVDLLSYHNIAGHKYRAFNVTNRMKDSKEPDKKQLKEIKLSFEKEGFEVNIGG